MTNSSFSSSDNGPLDFPALVVTWLNQIIPSWVTLLLSKGSSLWLEASKITAAELSMIFLPIFLYWSYSSFLYLLSQLNLTTVELHRIPTNQPSRPKNRVTPAKLLRTVALQHIVQAIIALAVCDISRPEDTTTWHMEPAHIVVLKIAVASVIMDSYQYWMHRWMHVNRKLYKYFHSVHHELTVPYAFGALYNHPVEGLLMDTLGGAIPSLLLDMHPWTACLFFCIATYKTVDDHCGYAWKWAPLTILGNGAEFHDIHHYGKGRMYNFSQPFYSFWDVWMGTEYHAAMAREESARKSRESVSSTTTTTTTIATTTATTTTTTTIASSSKEELSLPPATATLQPQRRNSATRQVRQRITRSVSKTLGELIKPSSASHAPRSHVQKN